MMMMTIDDDDDDDDDDGYGGDQREKQLPLGRQVGHGKLTVGSCHRDENDYDT